MDRMMRLDCKKLFFDAAGYERQILSRTLTKINTKSELIRQLDARWPIEQYTPVLMKQARRFVPRVPDNLPDSLTIGYETMFLHLDHSIEDILRWCGFDMDPTQMQAWLKVYRKWRNTNTDDVSGALQKFNKQIDYTTEKNVAKFLYGWWKAT
jgi:hypothetical protein